MVRPKSSACSDFLSYSECFLETFFIDAQKHSRYIHNSKKVDYEQMETSQIKPPHRKGLDLRVEEWGGGEEDNDLDEDTPI